jgi:hypothetical protein
MAFYYVDHDVDASSIIRCKKRDKNVEIKNHLKLINIPYMQNDEINSFFKICVYICKRIYIHSFICIFIYIFIDLFNGRKTEGVRMKEIVKDRVSKRERERERERE